MSSYVSGIYTYAVPERFAYVTGGLNGDVDLKTSVDECFKTYAKIRDNLIVQLNKIFWPNIELSEIKDHIAISDFIKNVFTDCNESTAAYKFYGCQIVDQINRLSDYIKEANAILSKWETLADNDSSIHADVVRLESLEQFCWEIHRNFGTRYYYDFDEDNWKLAEDDYSAYSDTMTYEQIDASKYSDNKYETLYGLTVKCNSKGEKTKVLDCFNELNLLDRLKYIRIYYGIKEAGKTNYVFPNGKDIGFPCVAEKGIEATDARIANLEKFYLGYLIDRDGPINAFCSLYEVKVAALQETISEMSKRIQAFNVYLNFINRALDVLNESQAKGPKRLPDGVVAALTYLCGQKMYNLLEGTDEKKYLVVPCVKSENKDKYMLIRADEEGMNILVGDMGSANGGRGNSIPAGLELNEGLWNIIDEGVAYVDGSSVVVAYAEGEKNPKGIKYEKYDVYDSSEQKFYLPILTSGAIADVFKLPTQLEVNTIIPGSVKDYERLGPIYETRDKVNEQAHAAKIESWTRAFSNKIEYINTAIDLVKTDIEQIRNKINTYQTQASTFRSRVLDVYLNTTRKVKG